MTEGDTSQAVVPAQPRQQSDTLDWLSKQTGTDVKEIDGQVVISFGPEIEKVLNVLAPVSQVASVNPHFRPTPRVVRLNIDSDAFEPNKGKFSLNKVGLSKLADLAQIEIIGQQKRPYLGNQGVEAIVTARMRGPDGTWTIDKQSKVAIYEVEKRSVERRLRAAAKKYKKAAPTAEDIEKAYDEELLFLAEKVATKAFLRCVRKLLSVKGTYTKAELAKPFLVVTWNFIPDWNDPNVAEMMSLQYREGAQELYGGEAPAPALPPPPPAEPEEMAVLPAAGEHAAAALKAAEAEAEAEAAEEEAEAAAPAAEPEGEEDGDPEAWDLDEEEVAGAEEASPIPKPEAHFKPNKGPFAGKDVEEIASSEEGKFWLANMVKRLRSDEKRAQALAWLEWATSGDVTADTLDEFIEASA